jgi:hypothetical protein
VLVNTFAITVLHHFFSCVPLALLHFALASCIGSRMGPLLLREEPTEEVPVEDFTNLAFDQACLDASHQYSLAFLFNHYFVLSLIVH